MNRRFVLLATGVVVGVAASLTYTLGGDSGTRPDVGQVIRLQASHATYDDLASIYNESAAVVAGTVTGKTLVDPGPIGVDPLGEPVPGVPHTQYVVVPTAIYKSEGLPSPFVVSVAGGNVSEGTMILEGVPEIEVGRDFMFFVIRGDDGAFYPLAGGTAVAAKRSDGSYELPSEAITSGKGLNVSVDDLTELAGRQGCGVGYWKSEKGMKTWPVGYDPSTTLVSLGIVGAPALSLEDALEQGGGGLNSLLRQGAAALLNAASTQVDFAYGIEDVITMLNQALSTPSSVESTKNLFEAKNGLGTPGFCN